MHNITALVALLTAQAGVGGGNWRAGNERFEHYRQAYEAISGSRLSDVPGFISLSTGYGTLDLVRQFALRPIAVDSILRGLQLGARMAAQSV